MKIKPIAFIPVLFLGLLPFFSVLLLSGCRERDSNPAATPYPPSQRFELLTIQALKESNPQDGFFDVEGYVAKIFSCPPCPVGAECMPCMPENIVISEKMGTVEAYSSISASEMIIFVQNPEDIFTLGEYYHFSIRVMDYRTTDEPINDVELLGFSH